MSIQEELLAFYNVENLFDEPNASENPEKLLAPFNTDSWTNERLTHKLEQIGNALAGIHSKMPLLVGLAEVENSKLLDRLTKTDALASTPYGSIHFLSADKRAMHCALLYDSSKLTLLKYENLKISLEEEPEFTTRDIGYAHFNFEEQQDLHIFVNHWSSRRDGKETTEHRRKQAAQVLVNKLSEIHKVDPNGKIVVMGDLNDEPSDSSIEFLIESAAQTGVILKNLMIGRTDGTLVRQRKWLLFDQMLVSQNFLEGPGYTVKNQRAEIFNSPNLLHTYSNGDTKPNATFAGTTYHGGYSDHLPIYLILE